MTPIDVATFTGLETMLISVLIGMLSCVVTFLGMFFGIGKRFMTRSECGIRHDQVAREDVQNNEIRNMAREQIQKSVNKLLANSDLHFRMLRGVISYMDLPPDKRTELLNMTPDNGKK